MQDPMETGREFARTPQKKVNPDGEVGAEVKRDWKVFKKVGTLCAKRLSSSEHMFQGPGRNSVWLEARGRASGENNLKMQEREAIILVNNAILIVYILVLILEDACSLRRLKRCR